MKKLTTKVRAARAVEKKSRGGAGNAEVKPDVLEKLEKMEAILLVLERKEKEDKKKARALQFNLETAGTLLSGITCDCNLRRAVTGGFDPNEMHSTVCNITIVKEVAKLLEAARRVV
jgi:hypothetical protein